MLKMNKISKEHDLSQIELQDLQHENCMKAMFLAYYNIRGSRKDTNDVRNDVPDFVNPTEYKKAQKQKGLSKQELFNFMLKSIGRPRKVQLVGTYHHVFVIPPTDKHDHFGIVTFSSPDVVKAIMFAADNINRKEVTVLDTDDTGGNDYNVFHTLCPSSDSVNIITSTFHNFVPVRRDGIINQGYMVCDRSREFGNNTCIKTNGLISYPYANRTVPSSINEDIEEDLTRHTPFIRMWHYHEYTYQSRGYQYFGYRAPLAQEMLRTYLKTNKHYVKKAISNYSKYADIIIQKRFVKMAHGYWGDSNA